MKQRVSKTNDRTSNVVKPPVSFHRPIGNDWFISPIYPRRWYLSFDIFVRCTSASYLLVTPANSPSLVVLTMSSSISRFLFFLLLFDVIWLFQTDEYRTIRRAVTVRSDRDGGIVKCLAGTYVYGIVVVMIPDATATDESRKKSSSSSNNQSDESNKPVDRRRPFILPDETVDKSGGKVSSLALDVTEFHKLLSLTRSARNVDVVDVVPVRFLDISSRLHKRFGGRVIDIQNQISVRSRKTQMLVYHRYTSTTSTTSTASTTSTTAQMIRLLWWTAWSRRRLWFIYQSRSRKKGKVVAHGGILQGYLESEETKCVHVWPVGLVAKNELRASLEDVITSRLILVISLSLIFTKERI